MDKLALLLWRVSLLLPALRTYRPSVMAAAIVYTARKLFGANPGWNA